MTGTQTKISVSTGSRGRKGTYTVHDEIGDQGHNSTNGTEANLRSNDVHLFPMSQSVAMPRRIGYVRVSTVEQETALQMAAMRGANCDLIFEEKRSSVAAQRHALDACLAELRPGDTLVCWKLDRLGRTMLKLLQLIEELEQRDIHFACITQGFDTSTPMGKLMLGILAAFAEFERATIIERTENGLKAAREKGHFGGRRRVLTGDKLARAKEAYFNRPISPRTGKRMTNDELAALFGIAKPTLQRWALHDGVPTWPQQRAEFLARNGDLDEWRQRTDDPMWGTNPAKRA